MDSWYFYFVFEQNLYTFHSLITPVTKFLEIKNWCPLDPKKQLTIRSSKKVQILKVEQSSIWTVHQALSLPTRWGGRGREGKEAGKMQKYCKRGGDPRRFSLIREDLKGIFQISWRSKSFLAQTNENPKRIISKY